MKSNVAEARTCTIKYFSEASVLYIFLTLDIRGINDNRLITRPIHAPKHELEDTDTNTPPTKVVSKRILIEFLGTREESLTLFMGYEPISLILAHFSVLRLVYYILVYGALWLLMLDGSNFSTTTADSSNGVTNTRCCRYSCLRS
jgi:hypothetical protein